MVIYSNGRVAELADACGLRPHNYGCVGSNPTTPILGSVYEK